MTSKNVPRCNVLLKARRKQHLWCDSCLIVVASWENVGAPEELAAGISQSSVQHVNGLAVYQEARSPTGEQGAFMVSAIVSATPREVFSVGLPAAVFHMPLISSLSATVIALRMEGPLQTYKLLYWDL